METEKFTDDPFKEAELELSIKLPIWLKNILILNGYDDQMVISEIQESDIISIENFAINTLPDLIEEHEKIDYFGIFKNNISKFKILEGFKKKLFMVVNFYKNKFNTSQLNTQSEKRKLVTVTSEATKKRLVIKNSSIIEKEIVNTDLTEEKKIILKQISEFIKQKYPKKEQFHHLISQLEVTVSISSSNCSTDEDGNLVSENNSSNDLVCKIKCYCGIHTTVYKLSSQSHKKKRWVFSNYYRHLSSHLQKEQEIDPSTSKKPTSKIATNSLHNYFVKSTNPSTNPEINLNADNNEYSTETINNTNNSEMINNDDYYMYGSPCGSLNYSSQDFNNSKVIEEANKPCLDLVLPSVLPYNEPPTSTGHPNKTIISKWKDLKYSRREREKRARESSLFKEGNCQQLITNFYRVVENVKQIINTNKTNLIPYFQDAKSPDCENSVEKIFNSKMLSVLQTNDSSSFLKLLCDVSIKNSRSKNRHSNRYSDPIKKFSVYLFFVGGRLLYETLQANLNNSLPSITSLFRYISVNKDNVVEGEYRLKKLKQFLIERNLPLCIWVSEDATRITGKIEYDALSNKIIGFVLPFVDGYAQTDSYIASSAKEIMKYFEIGIKSHYAYVIMAQPLSDNAPPFCIAIFGTDNKFTHLDVMARWKVINDLAADEGITVLGYSSDGDTRLLKSMQSKTYDNKINLSQLSQFFVQDTVHIGTKLRTRILKPGIELRIGSYTVSITHLFQLTELYSKDKHLLTNTDLNPDDKMNFNAAEKMCSDQVIELLKNIPDSQGTISFLKIMNNVLKSYLNKTIGVKERLYCLWHSVYLLRIWRCSVIKNNDLTEDLTLKNNFITSNAYSCIELNALALINIIKYFSKLENDDDSQMFLPWLYSSQTCEKLFRSTRSMTSTYSTVVNFSLKDFIRKLTRIEILNFIQNDLKITAESNPENNLIFPRERNPRRNYVNINEKISPKIFEKLSDIDIEDILCKSLADAKEEALLLGMSIFDDSINQPQFLKKLNVEQDLSDEERGENFEMCETQSSPEIPDDICSDLSDISSLMNIGEDLQLKDFTDSSTFLNSMKVSSVSTNSNANAESVENGPFINILLHNNKKMVIKKSSFCWLLDNKTERVSNDRLRRFINTDRPKKLNVKKTNNKSTQNISKTKKNNKFKTTSKIYKKSNLNTNLSEESADDQLFTNEESIKVSTCVPSVHEIEYYDPVWSDIKPGVFLLVKFAGGRKQTVFKYVCCVCDVNENDDEIIVQGFKKSDILGTQFSLKENDKSTIDYDMICAILPNPEIVDKTRKLIYQFPGYVTVIEK